jgi:hypothetical protein
MPSWSAGPGEDGEGKMGEEGGELAGKKHIFWSKFRTFALLNLGSLASAQSEPQSKLLIFIE